MIVRESSDAFYYVTFNQRRGRLSLAQQAVIRQIAQSLARAMMEREETLAPLPAWLLPPTEPVAQALLPATLNITYFRSTEMKKLVDELIKSLRYRGCTVNTNPISVSHWLLPNQRWEEEDLCLAFCALTSMKPSAWRSAIATARCGPGSGGMPSGCAACNCSIASMPGRRRVTARASGG